MKASTTDEVNRLLKLWGVEPVLPWTEQLVSMAGPPLWRQFMETAAVAYQFQQPADAPLPQGTFTIGRDKAKQAASIYTARRLEGLNSVNETTSQLIADQLAEGIGNGENISKLSARVRSVYDAETEGGEPMSRYRANMIARTESAQASTMGILAGWAEAGIKSKKWILSGNPCSYCVAAAAIVNAKATDVLAPFFEKGTSITDSYGGVMSLDFADVQGPPLHPHCGCALESVV